MTSGLDELAARVARLEDLEAIRATWLDYCNRLDTGWHVSCPSWVHVLAVRLSSGYAPAASAWMGVPCAIRITRR